MVKKHCLILIAFLGGAWTGSFGMRGDDKRYTSIDNGFITSVLKVLDADAKQRKLLGSEAGTSKDKPDSNQAEVSTRRQENSNEAGKTSQRRHQNPASLAGVAGPSAPNGFAEVDAESDFRSGRSRAAIVAGSSNFADEISSPKYGDSDEWNLAVWAAGLSSVMFTETIASELAQRAGHSQPTQGDFEVANMAAILGALGLIISEGIKIHEDLGVEYEAGLVYKRLQLILHLFYTLATGYEWQGEYKLFNSVASWAASGGDSLSSQRFVKSYHYDRVLKKVRYDFVQRIIPGRRVPPDQMCSGFWILNYQSMVEGVLNAIDPKGSILTDSLGAGILWEVGRAWNWVHSNACYGNALDCNRMADFKRKSDEGALLQRGFKGREIRERLGISCDIQKATLVKTGGWDMLKPFPDMSNVATRNSLVGFSSGWPDLAIAIRDVKKRSEDFFREFGGNLEGLVEQIGTNAEIKHWKSIWENRTRHGLQPLIHEVFVGSTVFSSPETYAHKFKNGDLLVVGSDEQVVCAIKCGCWCPDCCFKK